MRIASVTVALLFLGAPVVAETAGKAAGKPSSVLNSDRFLDRTVSITERRIYLGDLLERLGKASGANLEADERQLPLSGMELAVSVREKPVREVMEAITSLYSCPPDRWYWEHDRKGGRDRYLLHNTLTPGALRAWHDAMVEETFLRQFREMRAFNALPEPERNRLAATDPHYRQLNSAGTAALGSFFNRLSDPELLSVLRGGTVKIPVSQLTPAQRAHIQNAFDGINRVWQEHAAKFPNSPPVPERSFNGLENVSVIQSTLGSQLPTLAVDAGGTKMMSGLAGQGYQDTLREYLRKNWIMEGEDQEDPHVILNLPRPPVPAPGQPAGKLPQPEWIEGCLLRIGDTAHLNVLYDCNRSDGMVGTFGVYSLSREGKSQSVFEGFPSHGLEWKRRADFLLVRSQEWAGGNRENLVPWPIVRDLRAHAAANQGYPYPYDLITLARLSEPQRAYLATEFPEARVATVIRNPVLLALLTAAAGMTEMERAELRKGAGWEQWGNPTREGLIALLGRETAQNTHLLLKWDAGRPMQMVWGTWLTGERQHAEAITFSRWRDYTPEAQPRGPAPVSPMLPAPAR